MAISKKAPSGAQILDLGAARAARAEERAKGGAPQSFLKLSAGFVPVAAEVDVTTALDFQNQNIERGLSKLLADPDDLAVLLEDGITGEDLQAILEFITGVPAGESSASPQH